VGQRTGLAPIVPARPRRGAVEARPAPQLARMADARDARCAVIEIRSAVAAHANKDLRISWASEINANASWRDGERRRRRRLRLARRGVAFMVGATTLMSEEIHMKTSLALIAAGAAIGLAACMDSASESDEALTRQAAALAAGDPGPQVVQVPDELVARAQDGATPSALNGCGRLVYCADPRWTPHLPSFCTRAIAGCNNDKAFSDAIQLCRSVCAPTSICGGSYYVLGRC
jgi:hypothetical protein